MAADTTPTRSLTRVGRGQAWSERGITLVLLVCASIATVATLGILVVLLQSGWDFFSQVSIREFLVGTTWSPDHPPQSFGSLPLVKGTFQVALGAIALGVPLGVGSALFVSEFAGRRARRILKPTMEILAGIPSIVFGLVALFVVSPVIQELFPGTGVFNALSATIALAVMVIPIIAAVSEDSLRAVPMDLREASLALGSSKWETTWKVVLPAARSGVVASVILGFSRAIGETMAVTLAAGLLPSLSWNYLDQTQTITAYMANRAGGDLPAGSIEYLSIFALGLMLFLVTFAINLVAQSVLEKQRRKFA